MFCCYRSVAKSCLQPCGLQHIRLLCSPLSNSSSVVCWSSLISTVRGDCMQLFLILRLIFTLWNSRKHGGGCFFFFPGETFVKHYQQIITSSFKEPVFMKSQLTVSTWSFAMQLILKAGYQRTTWFEYTKEKQCKKESVYLSVIFLLINLAFYSGLKFWA